MNPLLAILLASASAVSFATFSVLVKKSAGETTAFAGNLISLSVGTMVLGTASLAFSPWSQLTLKMGLLFAAGGVMAPGIAQMFLFLGIRYVGVGRAMPLVTLSPILSTALAMALLGERPAAAVLAATVSVVAGCALLSIKPGGDTEWKRIWLLLPIAHAAAFAFAATLRRHALTQMPEPLIGAAIANFVSVPSMFLFYPFLPRDERISIDPEGFRNFALCGLVLTFSFFTHFAAYNYGGVSLVVPIVYSAPLFSLVLARFWLKEEERVNWQKSAGAILLFIGMFVIVWNSV